MEREEILNSTLSDNFNTNFVSFNWDQSVEQTSQFESAMSSLVSSPSNQTPPPDNVVIRELIGRLGSICNSAGELSPPSHLYNNNSTVASCYSTPLNSPPQLGLLMQEHHHQVWANLPVSGNPLPAPTATHLGGFTADPEFAKRAARFSSIDSNRYGGNGFFLRPECAGKLSRVSSSKSLKSSGCGESQVDKGANGNGREEPSGSDHGTTAIAGGSARKRKATLRGKAKVSVADDENGKKNRSDESKLDHENEKENNSKPPEPPKQDFIHVRARRGQATDSHSLAERVRREKISERMKFLQGLVPGCDKITGKAVMLDEIINYVQSLQRQVEFLSMKLATINPPLDLNMDNFIQKDMIGSLQHSVFPVEASGLPFPFVQSPFQCQTGMTNDLQVHYGSNPLDAKLRRVINTNLPSLDGFSDAASMIGTLWGDDYQSVAQMRSDQSQADAFSSQHFTDPSPSANMKIEP